MERAVFETSEGAELVSDVSGLRTENRPYGELSVTLWPDVPMLELSTTGGKFCVLYGEDIGKLIRWITEKGYKLD